MEFAELGNGALHRRLPRSWVDGSHLRTLVH
jgi:hypothetical protein